jgi:hypothetical protein
VFYAVKKMPVSEKYERMREALVKTILAFSYALIDKYGEEGKEIIKKVFNENNEEYMKLSMSLFNIKERDARTACSITAASDFLIGVKAEIVEFTPKRCVRRIKECPIYSESKKIGKKDEEVLELCETIMQSLCVSSAKAINPKLNYRYTRWLAKGDKYCEEVIELKATGGDFQ